MATVRSLYPPRCHDRQCPYNVWLYCSGPFPSQLEVQYWNVMYKSKLKGERAIWRDKPELLDPLPLPKKWKIPKLYCISWFKSSLRRSSSHSSLSTSYTDIRLPIDPYSPHAFTVNMNEQSKTKTQQEIHQPTCVFLSFLVSSVVSLIIVLIYLSQATHVMTSGMESS